MSFKVVLFLVLCLTAMNLAIVLAISRLMRKLDQVLKETGLIRRALVPPNIGGRAVPTPADIAAARNRTDRMGTAHPGGPG